MYYTTKTLSTAGTPAATAVDDDDASTVDLYAILMSWPTQTGTAQLANPPCSAGTTTASLLTGNGPVTLGVQCWTSGTGINISMPTAGLALDKKSFPTQYAYTIRLQNSLTGDAVTGNSAGHL